MPSPNSAVSIGVSDRMSNVDVIVINFSSPIMRSARARLF